MADTPSDTPAVPLQLAEDPIELPTLPEQRPGTAGYTPDERRTILTYVAAIVSTGKTQRVAMAMMREAGLKIGRTTLFQWRESDRAERDLWANAQVNQAHAIFEEMIDLADNAIPGRNGNVDKVRLQIDTRKFAVAKIAPRIYGEKLELTGRDGIPLIPTPATRVDLSLLTTEQLEEYAALTAIATVAVPQPADGVAATPTPDGI